MSTIMKSNTEEVFLLTREYVGKEETFCSASLHQRIPWMDSQNIAAALYSLSTRGLGVELVGKSGRNYFYQAFALEHYPTKSFRRKPAKHQRTRSGGYTAHRRNVPDLRVRRREQLLSLSEQLLDLSIAIESLAQQEVRSDVSPEFEEAMDRLEKELEEDIRVLTPEEEKPEEESKDEVHNAT